MTKPLIVFALEQESQNLFTDFDVLYTGVGKVNAAYGLMQRILHAGPRPSLVVNLGTAGSRQHKPGSIVNCTRFVQRDMDVTALGFAPYQTPFSDDPVMLEYGQVVQNLPQGVCATGDQFDTSGKAEAFDVVDMEGFALAIVCQRLQLPFLCLKYVSDGADGAADTDWGAALERAAKALAEALQKAGVKP